MRKLRRFGVVSSPRPECRDAGAACLRGLESAGFGAPAWVVDGGRACRTPGGEAVDFVLDLSGDASSSGGIDTPAFGVWSFDVDEGDPTGRRAMVAGRTSVGARLCARLGDDARVVLQEGMLPLSPVHARTRDGLNQILGTWPARAAVEIESGGWDAMVRQSAREKGRYPFFADAAGKSGTAPFRARLAGPWRRLRHWWRETARYDTWNVGIATLDRPIGDLQELRSLGAIRWLPPQRPLYFLADPFPYRHDGRDWLLVEDYGHPKGVRGRISRVDISGGALTIEPAIVRNSHLSYPFTFDHEGSVYCAAEMGAEKNGCIIYRLGDSGTWTPRHHILRDRTIVDPTFVRADNRWWLFCTDGQGAGSLVLYGFYADALEGPWTPHPFNPLKSDLSSARSAGRPFTIDGRLFRPAQDCSRTYGGAVNVMEIA
jgi:hypothetical protein